MAKIAWIQYHNAYEPVKECICFSFFFFKVNKCLRVGQKHLIIATV